MTTKEPVPNQSPAPVGAELDVAFTDLLVNGQAVGRAGGVAVFCFGPLPQERAIVRVTTVKPKYVVAKMLRLTEVSPSRGQPFCPVFGACGGCQLQHLAYPAQLAWKRDVVSGALQRIGGLSGVAVSDAIGMEIPRSYRNKMALVVDRRPGVALPTLGFYRQRSHDVVPIDACPIVAPQLSGYIARLNAARSDPAVAPAFNDARHIVARNASAGGQAVVTITTPAQSSAALDAAPALLGALPGAVGIGNSFDLSGANAILGRRYRRLAGSAEIEESIRGVRYRVSAESFFQINVEIVGKIFDFIARALPGPCAIVDFYCGAGTFSLWFARHGCDVFGIEENPRAVAEARVNAQLNGLDRNVRFQTGRVETAAAGQALRSALAAARIVFLDPPRKGSDEATLGAVAAAGVPNVWYLSCDPATLARDLKFLAAKGYRLGAVQPFDMFPQTGHVETLAMLHRSAKPPE